MKKRMIGVAVACVLLVIPVTAAIRILRDKATDSENPPQSRKAKFPCPLSPITSRILKS